MIYNKELKDFKFNYIKNYNVEKIKNFVKTLSNEWLIDTSRQDSFDVHKHTNSYILHKVSLNWKVGEPLIPIDILDNKEAWELVKEIVEELETDYNGKIGQVLFIKLEKNKDIDPHEDSGDYLYSACRFHIPIITNDGVGFFIDGDTQHMKEGECWEINNNKTHAVFNHGDEDRIHLLIDIVPNKFLP
jgi:hypothetical protein